MSPRRFALEPEDDRILEVRDKISDAQNLIGDLEDDYHLLNPDTEEDELLSEALDNIYKHLDNAMFIYFRYFKD